MNPDFSQVEVDQQVTNLTRFNIFLPEKRNFFLEMDENDAHTLLQALCKAQLSVSEKAVIEDTIEQLESFKLKLLTPP